MKTCCTWAAVGFAFVGAAAAAPQEQTCQFLKVMGSNSANEIGPMMDALAARWVPESRDGAKDSLEGLIEQYGFNGGTAYRIAVLGEDAEEHLVVLRLTNGEIAGARLLYEWTPDGLQLTTMDFKRKFSEIIATQFLQLPEPLACP
jgi:hypothetical protein